MTVWICTWCSGSPAELPIRDDFRYAGCDAADVEYGLFGMAQPWQTKVLTSNL